jgi:Domain of unknown function DUF29
VPKRRDILGASGAESLTTEGAASALRVSKTAMEPFHHRLISVDEDYHAWLLEQAEAVRNQQYDRVDWRTLAEKLDSMARAERRELRSRLTNLLAHLLKWRYQTKRRSRSWRGTITRERLEIAELLSEEPSLQSYLPATIERAYRLARPQAAGEMGLNKVEWDSLFPAECPWRFEQFMNEEFWPETTQKTRI